MTVSFPDRKILKSMFWPALRKILVLESPVKYFFVMYFDP